MSTLNLDEFEKLSAAPRKPRCQIAVARDAIPETEQLELDAACATERSRISNGGIEKWLAKRGHVVSLQAVNAHRSGKCTCSDE